MRVIDYRLRLASLFPPATKNSLQGHIKPRSQTRDVIGIGFAGAILDARQGGGRNVCLVGNIAQTQL
jgi:hypothetical protein